MATFTITRANQREQDAGVWVAGRAETETGSLYRFEALVYPHQADQAEFELGDSRVSKLWIQDRTNGVVVFNFDRGLDIEAKTEETKGLVVEICAELSQRIFGN